MRLPLQQKREAAVRGGAGGHGPRLRDRHMAVKMEMDSGLGRAGAGGRGCRRGSQRVAERGWGDRCCPGVHAEGQKIPKGGGG